MRLDRLRRSPRQQFVDWTLGLFDPLGGELPDGRFTVMPARKSRRQLGSYATSVSGENVHAYIPPPPTQVPESKLEGLHQHADPR